MTTLQKIFLLAALGYLIIKVVLGFIMYLITLRIEEKALEHKRRREALLKARRIKNLELYRRQYLQLEQRKREQERSCG